MKHKRDIATQKVSKYKARLNLHGNKQEQGIKFFDTYAQVITWPIIRLFLTLSILQKWHHCQVDFVLAYPQGPIKVPIDTSLPPDIDSILGKEKLLQLHRNIYGQK